MSVPLLSLREDMSRLSPEWLRSVPRLGSGPEKQAGAWLGRATSFLFLLLPSFVQSRLRPGPAKGRRLHPTSWLDGLRGVAAFIVFLWHFTVHHFGGRWYLWAYGVRDQDDAVASSPLQLPLVRVLYAGPAMVHVFFVVSGYALSHKPLRQLRQRDYGGLQGTLASSVFRRALRLFLPVAGLTLTLTALVRIGGPFEALPIEPSPTLEEQLRDWFSAMWTISSSWGWDQLPAPPPYDMALWTIPIEFCNSLLLFVVLMGLSRLKTHLRLLLLCGVAIYCLKCSRWASFEFLMGMALAEMGLMQEDRRARAAAAAVSLEDGDAEGLVYAGGVTSSSSSSSRSAASCLATLFFTGNLAASLFLAGWPAAGADQTPVVSTLWRITAEPFLSTGDGDRIAAFWHAIAATQMVCAAQQLSFLQAVFTTRLAQYLGDISFSLYLVHGSVLAVTIRHYLPLLWAAVGGVEQAGVWGRLFVWLSGTAMVAMPVVWVADVFARAMDAKSVVFARWVESHCTSPEG